MDKSRFRIVLSCLLGNMLEWFDFAVYGYIAPIIALKFFPVESKVASMLMTYGVFAIGFFARPLGAIIFGHMGDAWGRKNALLASIIIMAFPTFFMGLLPSYETIGIWAPILLTICRIFQGLSIGGEFTGSFVYLFEHADRKRKGIFSCWSDVGCCLGMMLGAGFVGLLHILLTIEQFHSYGWRIPFICGLFLALLGLYIRKNLSETPDFLATEKHPKQPLRELWAFHRQKTFAAAALVAVNAVGFYTITVYLPNQMSTMGLLTSFQMLILNGLALTSLLISTIVSAWLSDYYPRWFVYTIGACGCFVMGYPVFLALKFGHFGMQVITMILFSFAVGFCYGPRPTFLSEVFPVAVRYTGIGLAMNVGTAIFGGLAPMAQAFVVNQTGYIESPSLIIFAVSLLSLWSIFKLRSQELVVSQLDTHSFVEETRS